MKSAFELAMSRLEKESPSQTLTEEQKRQLAEVDGNYGEDRREEGVS